MGVNVSSTTILNDFFKDYFFSFLGPDPANVTIPLYATLNITVRVRQFVLLSGYTILCRVTTLSTLRLLSNMVRKRRGPVAITLTKVITQPPNQALHRVPIHHPKPDQSSVPWLHASQPWLSPELCYSGSTGGVEEPCLADYPNEDTMHHCPIP